MSDDWYSQRMKTAIDQSKRALDILDQLTETLEGLRQDHQELEARVDALERAVIIGVML